MALRIRSRLDFSLLERSADSAMQAEMKPLISRCIASSALTTTTWRADEGTG
eukprot:CAMPEP_0201640894 /NCGR_PEP_ID=MMETSP0493-20130528/22910_1 /ASSEMBLY_ACC=CAM_ASM_000838 /TAXON_ID=420259 /ORGANISM="Thalassiosira gravida, Strain GMp14c1" /LENGTH=51 /DNA_ID=CAMNT_0048114685 /DNA_START=48 /DNA_END=203 /DNA_ORIENTATION=-